MRPRHVLALLALLAPLPARAQEAPERLLSADTQIYLRWDGVDAHQAAYAKTSLGKILQGDTGKFVDQVFAQVREGLGALLTVDQLLGGADPDRLRQMEADSAQAAQVFTLLRKHGFVFAVEVKGIEPPQGQVTLILPGTGPKPEPLFAALRLTASLARQKVAMQKIGGRTVHSLALPPVTLVWWAEGNDAVVRLGLGPVEALVKLPEEGARLVDAPLFRRVRSFDKFRTAARGFLDIAAFVKMARTRGKEVGKLLDNLGVSGMNSLVLYSGFDGEAERGLIELDAPGPRKGLLKLLAGKPFKLEDVPPLPPDVVSWSMTHFDLAAAYDVGLQAARQIIKITSPENLKDFEDGVRGINLLLGLDLRKDLLGSLGTRLVLYNSPSEGIFTLGQTAIVEVRDAERLEGALAQLVKALATFSGGQVEIKRRTYRGVPVREVHVREQGFFFIPTYAFYKGEKTTWLAVSLFPQPVHGFIARAKGDLPAWKPDRATARSLKRLPGEFLSVSYSDPRPTVKQVLSVAPMIGGLVNSLNKEIDFDVASLPVAQDVTRHLFPNVSVLSDDGKTLRLDSRASLSLPLDIAGLDSYALFIFSAFAAAGVSG
jgi:hypothetical protein